MARPKEWERIARDLHISLQAVLDDILSNTQDGIVLCQNPECRARALRIDRGTSKARFLSRELQALIEDNNRTAADIEREVLARHPRKE